MTGANDCRFHNRVLGWEQCNFGELRAFAIEDRALKCLHAASEVAGFAKTGGLADVVGSLPIALQARGIECAVVMPLYRVCRSSKQPLEPTEHRFRLPIGNR